MEGFLFGGVSDNSAVLSTLLLAENLWITFVLRLGGSSLYDTPNLEDKKTKIKPNLKIRNGERD